MSGAERKRGRDPEEEQRITDVLRGALERESASRTEVGREVATGGGPVPSESVSVAVATMEVVGAESAVALGGGPELRRSRKRNREASSEQTNRKQLIRSLAARVDEAMLDEARRTAIIGVGRTRATKRGRSTEEAQLNRGPATCEEGEAAVPADVAGRRIWSRQRQPIKAGRKECENRAHSDDVQAFAALARLVQ